MSKLLVLAIIALGLLGAYFLTYDFNSPYATVILLFEILLFGLLMRQKGGKTSPGDTRLLNLYRNASLIGALLLLLSLASAWLILDFLLKSAGA
jgi:hypothetical protein